MPQYRIYRMKDSVRQQFRWAPHTIGITKVKPKDFEATDSVDAPNVYAAWTELRESGRALQVGDILEVEGAELRIYKYVGFEEGEWQVPEPKASPEGTTVSVETGSALAP